MISLEGRTTHTLISENGETIYLPIKINEFGHFLDWYEKTKNHYHFKTELMNKLLDKIRDECKNENLVIDDINIILTLRHPDVR